MSTSPPPSRRGQTEQVRIYLPSTLDELGAGDLGPRVVHAVTSALRAALPDEDEEGLEYAAQLLAADDSLDLLGTPGTRGRRRVVIAADVPEALVEVLTEQADDDAPGAAGAPGTEHAPSAVRLTSRIPWRRVACAHVDEGAAERDVVAALAGDEQAVERLTERDLLWYDVTELSTLAPRR